MTPEEAPKTTGEMMSDILTSMGSLMRNEVDLARAELAESVGRAGNASIMMALAFVLGLTALDALVALIVLIAVAQEVSAITATAVVTAVLLILAIILFLTAKTRLKQTEFVPVRAARNIQRDAAAIQEAYNDK